MAIPILVGPTGAGKTAVALETARRTGADVISADSRQIYRRLTVGTAKPVGRWARDAGHPLGGYYAVEGVPHHLMDFLEPTETYNAGLFARSAEDILSALAAAGRPALLAGGTGLYLRALADGLAPLPGRDEAFRREMAARAEREGRRSLHEELAKRDPASAAAIPANNLSRVVRALEVHRLTGRPLSWWQKEKTVPSKRDFLWFGLLWPKEELESRLAERCRGMIKGLLAETAEALSRGVPADAPGLQALGYGLAIAHLQEKISRRELEDRLFLQTRQYAKRQMTWFRADKRIRWLPVTEPFDPVGLAARLLSQI